MRATFIILLVAVTLPQLAMAQFTPEHSAMNNLKKGKWEKARTQLAKSIRKDSLNPSAHYALSVYFFTPSNPDFHIDSAYQYTMQGFSDYQNSTLKQRDRLRKIPLDSLVLVKHRQRIDSAAFSRAKSINTEGGYIDFLSRFLFASERVQATELRDEVAYLDALKENTYEVFLLYLEKYPESVRALEARTRYEKLLFEAKTTSKKLAAYESFLLNYPSSPYRSIAEKQIFEIATASGESRVFAQFLKKYPQSIKASQARNILYHLLKEDDQIGSSIILNDSIRDLQKLEKVYLVPFFKDDSFGFMDERGLEIIKPVSGQLNDNYLCGNITDELLVFDNKIIARNGVVVYRGEIKEVEILGYGFIKIRTGKCVIVTHFSGYRVGEECFQDAKLLKKNLLALQKDKRWSVWTLGGRKLLDYEWDDVQVIEDVIVFQKSGKYKLTRISDVVKTADQVVIPFTRDYDEVKALAKGMIWVKVGNQQGVLNQNLTDWVKLEAHEITPTFFGAVSKSSIGNRLYNFNSGQSQMFFRAIINQPWVAVQQDGAWSLFDPMTKQVASPAYDSIQFVGPLSIGLRNDSVRIYITKENYVEFTQHVQTKFFPGKDSLFFLMIEEADRKIVYNSNGKLMFTGIFDKIEYSNEGFFKILKKDKYGLVGLDGKLVVQPVFDALGNLNMGVIQTLKDKKFGLVDVVKRKEMKPVYEKNLVRYNASVFIASKNGFYGLIDWDSKMVAPFEFEEIRYWNDSAAIVKKNFNWMIYNFVERRVIMDKIKTFKWVLDTDQEKIMIVQQENKYGVISNRKGTIIPATFTDIVNLGSETVPLYFTEKHVEEASIFVVIYYDKNGIQLRKQVFEIADYERIYCSDN